MIVASIRNNFQPHALSGFGCADCSGNCKGMGLGDCPSGFSSPSGTVGFCLPNVSSIPAVPLWAENNCTSSNCPVFCPGGGTAPIGQCGGGSNFVAATPVVAQTVQQTNQVNGIVPSIPLVSNGNVFQETIFGIPLWVIGGGALALFFIGSGK